MSMKTWFANKWKKLRLLIVREKASPEYIARGWAIGMFYGCLIPFGFQLACSIPTAFLLKGSKIGATFGTLLTNPVTIFFIYPVQCWVGNKLLGGNMDFSAVEKSISQIVSHSGPWWESYQILFKQGIALASSFFLGGFLLALITTPITYVFVYRFARSYALFRAKHKRRHLNKKRRKAMMH